MFTTAQNIKLNSFSLGDNSDSALTYKYPLPGNRILQYKYCKPSANNPNTITQCELEILSSTHEPLELPLKKRFETTVLSKFLCILTDGTILFKNRQSLFKICSQTLNILSIQPIPERMENDRSFYAAINPEYFFLIQPNQVPNSAEQTDFSIVIYNCKNSPCTEFKQIPLVIRPQNSYISSLSKLGNQRYYFMCRSQGTDEVKILVFSFNLNVTNVENKENTQNSLMNGIGMIELPSLGEIIGLANGKLLTRSLDLDNLQLWDTNNHSIKNDQNINTFTCLKEWKFDEINPAVNFSPSAIKIKPFPDSNYLLILHQKKDLYLFNMHTDECKLIEFTDSKLPNIKEYDILPNGDVIVFFHPESSDDIKTMRFGLPEICENRVRIRQSQTLVRGFFNRIEFPREITDHIMGHAFTPRVEIKNIFAIQQSVKSDCNNESDIPTSGRSLK